MNSTTHIKELYETKWREHVMSVKIAAFGRKENIKRLKQYTKENKQIEIIPQIYNKVTEIIDLMNHVYQCDVYLFTEAYPYLYVKDKIQKNLPIITVPYDEYMVLTSFFHLLKETNRPLGRLSIDVLNQQQVNKVLTDLRMDANNVYVIDYKSGVPIDTIVSFHYNLWKEGKVDYVLTTIHDVSKQLTKLGVPNKRIHVPIINMKQAIEKCTSMVQFNQDKTAQVVACYVRVRKTDIHNIDTLQQQCEKLQAILKLFAQKTHSSVVRLKQNKFVLFGTKEMLTYVTNNYRHFPLLERINEMIQIPVDIGFGLGLNAEQAEKHANLAIDVCAKSPQTSCYLINDSQETIGPIGVKKHLDPAKLYQALIHRARLNNETSYHFIDFITLRNNEPFSSHDVADYYRVTKRSAERTINKLLGGKVIKVVGEEKPYTRGRPRKLYKVE